jgi:predicted ribosome quality control (RQC) complex YloA/Tae2 family protein
MEITSLDLSILEEEFKYLEDGHVQKVYQRGEDLTLEIYVPGDEKKRLIVGTEKAFISKYKRDNPMKPPGFCMELRKHMGKIDRIEQKGFDRILVIQSRDTKLICELFGRGNYILTNEDKIIGALREEKWADREIRVGLEYEFPEPADDPRGEDYIDMLEEGELVRRLASDLSLGGTYAEEICHRLGLEKDLEVGKLDGQQKKDLKEEIGKFLDPELSPVLYIDELPKRSAPFPLETYSSFEKEHFDTFSKALDEFYYRKKTLKEKKRKRDKYQEELEGLKQKKDQQERKIQGLKKSSEQNRRNAELIYENYNELQEAKEAIEKGIETQGWDETEEKLRESENDQASNIKTLNQQDDFFSYDLDDQSLKIYLFQDLEATASGYYDKAKNSEQKMESAEKALENTKKEIESLGEEDIELEEVMEDKSEKRSKKWFEKYRWFYSRDGFLVCIGKDAQTNEMLVKKHMDSNDLYLHSDFDGAPSVVIKEGQEAPESTLKEAGRAAVTFTKAWKAGIGAADVYYVDPDQVTRDPESGEYLSKGAFVIRGDREYLRNVKIDAAVGPYEIEEGLYVPVCGPKDAVEENCPEFIELRPGHEKKSEVAKSIRANLEDYDLDVDYLVRCLPPGKSELAS